MRDAGCDVPRGTVLGPDDPLPEVEYPVVVKTVGLTHKSDHGGVIVNVTNEEALGSAVTQMRTLSGNVLVERQVTEVVAELLVTVHREPPIGLILTLGAGGELVELIDSTSTVLLPINDSGIADLLDGLPIGRLLGGLRGRPPADMAAVISTVQTLVALMARRQDIVEIEVNPLLATTRSAVVADALITVKEAT